MNKWNAPQRPAAYTEQSLVTSILEGRFSPGSTLPSERELAVLLGVTRPTLREALRRLESDGWLTVQQGKPTRVNDFWRVGGLKVLNALVRYGKELPPDFIPNLLEVRLSMAPAYTRAAIQNARADVAAYLSHHTNLPDQPEAYAAFDWGLHHSLTVSSGNPIYTLILNGFAGFYEQMACIYFERPAARARSAVFYRDLLECAQKADGQAAERLTRQVMEESISLWRQAEAGGEP